MWTYPAQQVPKPKDNAANSKYVNAIVQDDDDIGESLGACVKIKCRKISVFFRDLEEIFWKLCIDFYF